MRVSLAKIYFHDRFEDVCTGGYHGQNVHVLVDDALNEAGSAAGAEINATLKDDKIKQYKHANVGLAVDTERGLLVPTIFGADTMSLAELAKANKAAAAKAKEGTLTPDEMSGGSFTVTNLGSLGVESFTPVINPPQVAILGVCAMTNRLRDDGTVYPAMGLSLTFDHRAIDGAPAARFLKDLCTALENFGLLLAK